MTYDESNTTGINIITNYLGCDSIIQNIEIFVEELQIDVFVSDVICFQESNGSIEISGNESNPLTVIINAESYDVESLPFLLDSLSPGVFEISVISQIGCIEDYLFEIVEGEIVSADLEGSLQEGTTDTIELVVNTNTVNGEFAWQTVANDTICSDCNIILSLFESNFIYSVQVKSENGCMGEDSFSLFESSDLDVQLPNIFTPNNDGINDFFTVTSFNNPDIVEIKLGVYDRWGSEVFQESDETEITWNGSKNGRSVQQGVYPYIFEMRFLDGSSEFIIGNLTLMR